MPSLFDLQSLLPLVHAKVLSAENVRLLCSHAPDPDIALRRAVVADYTWGAAARLVAEIDGAQRFLLPLSNSTTEHVVARSMTAGGTICEVGRDGIQSQREIVSESSDGPFFLGRLCCIHFTQHEGYVGGMARQLFRSDGQGVRWERADRGLLDRSHSSLSSAVYGLALTPGGEPIAVGGDGEIWWERNHQWHLVESGTNTMLNAVAHIPGNGYLICGSAGVILWMGYDGIVTYVESSIGKTFLSAIEILGDNAFVVAGSGLHSFSVSKGVRYIELVPNSEGINSIVSGRGFVWAFGSQCIGRTKDGERWQWIDSASVGFEVPGPTSD